MHTKFIFMMVLAVVRKNSHIISYYSFLQSPRISATNNIEVLDIMVKPQINEWLYIFQQDTALSHLVYIIQAKYFHNHVTSKVLPPCLPDLDPLGYLSSKGKMALQYQGLVDSCHKGCDGQRGCGLTSKAARLRAILLHKLSVFLYDEHMYNLF